MITDTADDKEARGPTHIQHQRDGVLGSRNARVAGRDADKVELYGGLTRAGVPLDGMRSGGAVQLRHLQGNQRNSGKLTFSVRDTALSSHRRAMHNFQHTSHMLTSNSAFLPGTILSR